MTLRFMTRFSPMDCDLRHAPSPFRPSASGKPQRHETGLRPTRTSASPIRPFICILKSRTVLVFEWGSSSTLRGCQAICTESLSESESRPCWNGPAPVRRSYSGVRWRVLYQIPPCGARGRERPGIPAFRKRCRTLATICDCCSFAKVALSRLRRRRYQRRDAPALGQRGHRRMQRI